MYMIQRQHSTDHSSPGDLCWSSQHLAPGPTDCGAAPAPYINKPHRPPTRPTSRLCPLSLDLHRSTINYNSPVASDARLSRTLSLKSQSNTFFAHPQPCLPRRPKVLPPRPSLALPTPATRLVSPSVGRMPASGDDFSLVRCLDWKLMRGRMQDMITDAILNVCWQPSVAPAHLFALYFPVLPPPFTSPYHCCPSPPSLS